VSVKVQVKVKICGVCSVDDARAAVAAGADFIGLNFHPASPRAVTVERACAIADALPGTALVGVFVDAARDRVEEVASRVGLAAVQFHGDEDVDYCRGWPWRVIKALRARSGTDLAAEARRYDVDYVLVDTFVAGRPGGTGVALDPAVATGLPAERLFVAGGLRPDTVADVVRALRPYAVDVASGVEERPGRKDHGKVEDFVRRAKNA
jgi:phosphoribosylanthranilate isomerase